MRGRIASPIWMTGCLGLFLSGCAYESKQAAVAAARKAPQAAAPEPSYDRPLAPAEASPPGSAADARLASDTDLSKARPQRLLIYTASLQMAVADVDVALAAAQKLAEDAGGYLARLTSDSITIRIPAATFREILDRLRPLGQTVSRQIDVQDITDEYVDLQLRLRNAESLMERLESLLAKAQSLKDTMEIEREMNRLRTEIERIKGRLAQLDKQIAFSTITVTFVKASAAVVLQHRPESPFPWLDELGVERVLRIHAQGGAE